MGHRRSQNDDGDEPESDIDEAEDDELAPYDDDEAELVACPACGLEVYEDAEQCPSCGEYITHSTSALAGRPAWMIGLFLAGVLAVIFAMIAVF